MVTEPSEFRQRLLEIQNSVDVVYTALPSDEPRFIIDANSRTINIPIEFQFLGVKNDHNAETIYFEIDRYFDDEDLSQHTCVIQFANKNNSDDGGIYPVTTMDTTSVDGKIIFGWEIKSDATSLVGDIYFSVRFYSIDSENYIFTYNFNTLTAKSSILDTHNVDNQMIIENYPSELDAWIDRMNELEAGTSGKVEEIEAKGQEVLTEINSVKDSIPEDYSTLSSDVDGLKGDLVDADILKIVDLSTTKLDNGYVKSDGYVYTVESWCHTNYPIILKPNCTIVVTAQGYQNDVSVISENIQQSDTKIPLVLSDGSDLKTYKYKNNTNSEKSICLSFYRGNDYDSFIVGSLDSYKQDIENLKTNTVNKETIILYPNHTNGYFIKSDGTIVTSPNYFVTDIIELNKDDIFSVTSADPSGDNVSRVVICNDDGITTSVLNYGTTDLTTFTFTASENVKVRVSGYINNQITITKSYIKTPVGFDNLIKSIIDEPYATTSMFDDIAVCGDSYTAGAIFNSSGTLIGENEKTRWGSVLQRMSGVNVTTYAKGGADTSTFLTWENCLPNLLSDNPHELYVLCLGINDRSYLELGTIADVNDDYTQNPNTFYGNYGKIIAQIKAHAPNAKIIISKVFIVSLWGGPYYEWSSNAIEEISSHFNIPFIDTADEPFFSSDYFNNSIVGGHPVSPSYSAIAKGMNKLISKCIQDNKSYFDDYYPN